MIPNRTAFYVVHGKRYLRFVASILQSSDPVFCLVRQPLEDCRIDSEEEAQAIVQAFLRRPDVSDKDKKGFSIQRIEASTVPIRG